MTEISQERRAELRQGVMKKIEDIADELDRAIAEQGERGGENE